MTSNPTNIAPLIPNPMKGLHIERERVVAVTASSMNETVLYCISRGYPKMQDLSRGVSAPQKRARTANLVHPSTHMGVQSEPGALMSNP